MIPVSLLDKMNSLRVVYASVFRNQAMYKLDVSKVCFLTFPCNLLVIVFLLTVHVVDAQELKVMDGHTKLPLEEVEVWTSRSPQKGRTDADGVLSLNAVVVGDSIYLFKEGYRGVGIDVHELKAIHNWKVNMYSIEATLPDVEIASTRWGARSAQIAHSVQSVSKKDIQYLQPGNMADALTAENFVFMQRSQQGGGSPMMRGFAANRLLLAVDGVRMNNAIFRSGNLQQIISIDPLNLEAVDIILGPGAIAFGSDAIGGALHFRTLAATLSDSLRVNGSTQIRFSSANQERHAAGNWGVHDRRWSWVGSLSFTDFGDLRQGSFGPEEYLRPDFVMREAGNDIMSTNPDPRIQKGSGYHAFHTLQKVKVRLDPHMYLQYAFHFSTTSDVPRYDRLIEREGDGTLRFAEWTYDPQQWLMHHLSLQEDKSRYLYDQFKVDIAYQWFEESRIDRRFGRVWRNIRTERLNAWSANMDFRKSLSTHFKLYYGSEFLYQTVQSSATAEHIHDGASMPISTRYPNSSFWYSGAAYLQAQYEPHTDWLVEGSFRYSNGGLGGVVDTQFYNFPFQDIRLNADAFNYALSAIYKPSKVVRLHALLGTGFRMPNLDDVSKIFDSEPGSVTVPNPDLRPEFARNVEIGIQWQMTDQLEFQQVVYYTHLKQAMVRRPFVFLGSSQIEYDGVLSDVIAIVNAANAWVYGLESRLKWQLNASWMFRATYSHQRGHELLDDGSSAALRHAAPGFGQCGLQYQKSKWRIDGFVCFNEWVPDTRLAPSEVTKRELYAKNSLGQPFTPAWWTFHVHVHKTFQKKWHMHLNIDNLFDKRYRPYGSGISGPGRNVSIALRYTW